MAVDRGVPFLSCISTEMMPAPVRVAFFREEFGREAMKADIVDRSGGAPQFDFTVRRFGPVRMGTIVRTPCEFIYQPRDELTLHLIGDGPVHVRHHTLEYVGDAGAGHLLDQARPCHTISPRGGRLRNVGIDPAALRGLVRHPRDAIGLQRNGPMLRLLDHYLAGLEALDTPPDAALAEIISVHLLDLIAAVIGPAADAREMIGARGVQAARLRAILWGMDRHFTKPQFTVSSLAAQLGVTRRYVHLLLERTGRTFSQHMLDRRLRHAHALLRDPGMAPRRIIDIAGAAGFDDISYFNRRFRARFGDTPSGVRRLTASDALARSGHHAGRAMAALHRTDAAMPARTTRNGHAASMAAALSLFSPPP